jgi:hypothetical protein
MEPRLRHPGFTGSDLVTSERRRESLLDAAQFTDRPRDFDRLAWITDVERAAQRVPGCTSVVAPFGFEPIFDGPHTIKPRRFYVYLTTDRDAAGVESDLANAIVGSALPDTRIVVTSTETEVRRDGHRGSLYVRRIGSGTETAVGLYARYLAALPLLFAAGRLRERRDFPLRPSARRYLLHTTVALAALHPEVEPPGLDDIRLIARLAREQSDRDPETGAPPEVPVAPEERRVLDGVVVPFFTAIAGWLTESGTRPVEVVDVHNGERARVPANEDRLDAVAARIVDHYRCAPSRL